MKTKTLQILENEVFDILKKELDACPVYGENGRRKQVFEFEKGIIYAERYDSFEVVGDDYLNLENVGFSEIMAKSIEIFNNKNKLLKNISNYLTSKKINYDKN